MNLSNAANAAELLHQGYFESRRGASQEEERPTHKDLAEWLTFDPDKGRIWLDEERVVMLHHQTLGALRNELIQLVGVESARSILTRCGYMAGVRDARFIGSRWPKDHPVANLRAGTRLFGLQGLASVETVHFEYDPGRVSFNGEFFWHHSLEDDEHIAAFGVGTDAGCWMPIGYANGYVSTICGAPIVFREVECRSTGAALCRVIGKAASEWDDVEEDLRYMRAEGFVGSSARPAPSQGSGRSTVAAAPVASTAATAVAAASAGTDTSHPAKGAGGPLMVGISSSFNAACHMLRKVAGTTATVLFTGESGVGKELFARMLHEISQRSHGPFISINCAAIPDTLVEAELFGVERGAYTGAGASRAGRFERSSGGTLFLDEVASLSLVAQSKLLRALQEGEIERVGGVRSIKLDLRVVAACNVDLREEVRQGRFREDLFYRLNVYPIHLPPLRSRSEDIPVLMTHFLRLYRERYGREIHGFTPRAMRAMLTYTFPGNIRELQNMIERAVIAANDESHIDTVHLFRDELFSSKPSFLMDEGGRLAGDGASGGMGVSGSADGLGALPPPFPAADAHLPLLDRLLHLRDAVGPLPDTASWLEELETQAVHAAVERCDGNMAAAARLLGMKRMQVVYRMRKQGFDIAP